MPTFEDIAAVNIDIHSILNSIFKADNIQKWVTFAIQKRLYGLGTTGTNKKLITDLAIEEALGNFYASSTINEVKPPGRFRGKKQRGQKYSNVTLSNDGDFYSSMKMTLTLFGFELDADFDKEDGHIQKNFTNMYSTKEEFEDDVMSLTDSELDSMLKTFIIPQLKIKIHEALYIT